MLESAQDKSPLKTYMRQSIKSSKGNQRKNNETINSMRDGNNSMLSGGNIEEKIAINLTNLEN